MQDSARIMENVCKIVPSLRGAKVVREWVGLRPYREPVRLELQHHEVPHQCSCTNACRVAPLAWCKSLQSSWKTPVLCFLLFNDQLLQSCHTHVPVS